MTERGSRAIRLAAEFGTIVLGVLVALGAEAWWQNREEADREAQNLQVLADDLRSTDSTLVRVIREDSTFTVMILEDLAALRSADTAHVLRLPLTVSDYRLRTGGLNRLLAAPGPTLKDSPALMALLSDLQAEIRLVDRLNATMTAELFRYVQGTVQAQEEIRVSGGAAAASRVEALGGRPGAVASITMVMVILRNRDNLHRRLQRLVREVRQTLETEAGVTAPDAGGPVADSVPPPPGEASTGAEGTPPDSGGP